MAETAAESPNPYRAPASDLAREPESLRFPDAASFRRAYVGHETAVKLVRLPAHLVALFGVAGLVVAAVEPTPQGGGPGADLVRTLLAIWPILLLVTVVCLVLGYGLRRLRPWARWVSSGLAMLVFVAAAGVVAGQVGRPGVRVGAWLMGADLALLGAYTLRVMLAPRARVVFTPEYRVAVYRTPRVRPSFAELAGPILSLASIVTLAAAAAVFELKPR